MKKVAYLLLMTVLWSACIDKDDDPSFINSSSLYKPIIMDRTEMEQAVIMMEARPLTRTGKIYQRGQYLFISELYEGVHLINNIDPAHPINEGFIRIPGCVDIAAKGATLYANSAVDLLAIDLNALPEISITSRSRETFPELIPPNRNNLPSEYTEKNRPKNSVIINWVQANN